jgi:hypothetical protein
MTAVSKNDVFSSNIRIAYQMLTVFDDIKGGSLNDPNAEYFYPEWDSLPKTEKRCFIRWFKCAAAAPSASVLFNRWVTDLAEQGWISGPQYNSAKKESPLLVGGWRKLPALHRKRLVLFYNVVKVLTKFSSTEDRSDVS